MIFDWYRFGLFCVCLGAAFLVSGIHGIFWLMVGIAYASICEN